MRPENNDTLATAVGEASRRLAARRGLRAASLGGWIGTALSALWMGGWLLRWAPLPDFAWLLAPPIAVAIVGGLIGRATFRAREDELALLIDRLLGSEEIAITALGLREVPKEGPLAHQVVADAEALLDGSPAEIRARLPMTPPRHLRFLPLAVLAVAAMTFLPRAPIKETPAGPAGDMEAEADRLEQRKEQLEAELDTVLPDELEAEFSDLLESMKDGSINKNEAAEQAQELADKLDTHARQSSSAESQALRDAADDLKSADPELAQDLEDALSEADLEEAQEAVERMRERMEQASPEERERAAREMELAADNAMKSPLPGLGGALKSEAGMLRKQQGGGQGQQQQAGANGGQQAGGQGNQQQGGQQQGGQQGQQQGGQGSQQQGSQGQQGGQQGQQQGGGQQAGGQGQQQGGQQGGEGGGQSGGGGLSEYLQQLEEQGLGGDGLAQEEAQSQMNQEMEQALGGAAGRLGGMEGATGNQGRGKGGKALWGAGSEHSAQDEGTFDTTGMAHQDMDRQVNGETSDWVVPFDQDHAPERLQGVSAVASTVDVPLGEGSVDVEYFRLSGSEERSGQALIQAPAGYREAAEEAIDGEGIPRAYRDQVKTYFDAIETED
ncbi:MAG: hypothetical protein GY898_11690 [Proteobacteria bacterium]|nr:hypothetical protein [Pseudomonadota bacterium]